MISQPQGVYRSDKFWGHTTYAGRNKHMKKLSILFILVLAAGLLISRTGKDDTTAETLAKSQSADVEKAAKLTTGRSEADYASALKKLSAADEVGNIIYPERNAVRYPFIPLKKGGKIIAYGTWVNLIIYKRPEDLLVIVNPDGTLQTFEAMDAHMYHQNMHNETWKSRFYGMTKDRDFDHAVDANTGSSISVNTMFGELKNVLLVFNKYVDTTSKEAPKKPETLGSLSTGRTVEDYVAELKTLSDADEAGAMIFPQSNTIRYPFIPLKKDGELIGYGTWVNLIIYNRPEDLLAIVNPDGTLQTFKAIDAHAYHRNMHDETWKSRFYGMTQDRDFEHAVDANTGSSISVNTVFAELKNILVVFNKFVVIPK